MVQLVVFLLVLPFLSGICVLKATSKDIKSLSVSRCIVDGLIILYAIFHVLCIPITLLKLEFSVLCHIYTLVIDLIIILGVLCCFKKCAFKPKTKKKSLYAYATIGIILLQIMVLVMGNIYQYGDDKTYLALVNDIVENNHLYLTDWKTGLDINLDNVSVKYVFTSYYPFLAYISVLSGLHPLIVCKTILPIFYILYAYMVIYENAKLLFQNEKKEQFMFIYSLLVMFGGYSWYSISFRYLTWVWQSKAFLAIIVLPMVFCYSYSIMNERVCKRKWVMLILANIVAGGSTLMGLGLAPLMVFGMFLANLNKSDWKQNIKRFIVASIPAVFSLAMIFVYKYI